MAHTMQPECHKDCNLLSDNICNCFAHLNFLKETWETRSGFPGKRPWGCNEDHVRWCVKVLSTEHEGFCTSSGAMVRKITTTLLPAVKLAWP